MNSTVLEGVVDVGLETSGVALADTVTYFQAGPQTGPACIAKRLFDFTAALLLLMALMPLLLLIAFAIVIDSGWSPLFVQKRMGQNGRVFSLYKFRSMCRNAEQMLEEVRQYNEIEDGPIFKWKKDPRITRVGRILRASSLDELPQLINVLLGNMSLVGPRPPLEAEVLQYEPWQLRRLAVKPGMTGLWQVSGRSQLGFTEMVELDIAYIECWSFWQDLRLLLKTPAAVISTRGAY